MKKNIRIGYVTTSLSSVDGWGRYSKSLVESVSKKTDTVVMITEGAQNECSSDIPVYSVLPKCTFHPIAQMRVFLRALKYFKGCDVVHSLVEPYSPGLALASILLRARLVITLHGTYSVPPRNFSLKKLLMWIVYKRVKIATTGSIYTEKKVREIVSFGECRFIPNGVDDSIFYKIPNSKDEKYIITVGALKARKGADLVIKSLLLLSPQFSYLKYKIIGISDDKNYISHLQKLIEDSNLKNRVELVGRVEDDKLRQLYNNASIFVLAARDIEGNFEGFPMVFYEANSCGIPVITTKGFGSEYAIKDGQNGYVIEPENPKEIANTMEIILKDQKLMDSLKKQSLSEASKHTWSKIADRIVEMYIDALHYK